MKFLYLPVQVHSIPRHVSGRGYFIFPGGEHGILESDTCKHYFLTEGKKEKKSNKETSAVDGLGARCVFVSSRMALAPLSEVV